MAFSPIKSTTQPIRVVYSFIASVAMCIKHSL